jgi:adenine-specific DNA-methyltransferase
LEPPVRIDDRRVTARDYDYIEAETNRRYTTVPIHAAGVRRGETGKPWRGRLPPRGKHWQVPPSVLDELDAKGEIHWSATGNPQRKIYLGRREGTPVHDIWLDYRDARNQSTEITGYPTKKPLRLLRRIMTASSNPDDLVLDCFVGSGTSVIAAEEAGRRWIGVDARLLSSIPAIHCAQVSTFSQRKTRAPGN